MTVETAFRTHAPALRGRLLGLTRDPSMADDLVTEASCGLPSRSLRVGCRSRRRPGSFGSAEPCDQPRSSPRRGDPGAVGLLDRGLSASPEDAVLDRERDLVPVCRSRDARWRDRRSWSWPPGATAREIARLIGCAGAGDPDSPVPCPWPTPVAARAGRHDRVAAPAGARRARPATPARTGAYHRAVVDDARARRSSGGGRLDRLVDAYARAAIGQSWPS